MHLDWSRDHPEDRRSQADILFSAVLRLIAKSSSYLLKKSIDAKTSRLTPTAPRGFRSFFWTMLEEVSDGSGSLKSWDAVEPWEPEEEGPAARLGQRLKAQVQVGCLEAQEEGCQLRFLKEGCKTLSRARSQEHQKIIDEFQKPGFPDHFVIFLLVNPPFGNPLVIFHNISIFYGPLEQIKGSDVAW